MAGRSSVCTPRSGGGNEPRRLAGLHERIASQSCQPGDPQSCPSDRAPRLTGVCSRSVTTSVLGVTMLPEEYECLVRADQGALRGKRALTLLLPCSESAASAE